MELSDNVKEIKGVGDKTVQLLNKVGIFTVNDLLTYYPRSYDVFKLPVPVGEVSPGNTAAIECMIYSKPEFFTRGKKKITSLTVRDPSGIIKLVWYNSPYAAKGLITGMRYIFRGRIERRGSELHMTQPVVYTKEKYVEKLAELQPVYRLTAGLTNNMLHKYVKEALPALNGAEDYLPAAFKKSENLLTYKESVREIHFPVSKERYTVARKRAVFDEMFIFMAGLRALKDNGKDLPNLHRVEDFSILDDFENSLPYELTAAQKRTVDDIKYDLASDTSMCRMVQGDVGCGKTIVAAMAVLACIKEGYQCCIMAPTDILANQHYQDFMQMFSAFGVRVTLLSGHIKVAQKRKAYEDIKLHNTDLIIGTHAILQEGVEFDNLGLAVIDEQHRFGVKQREILQNKGMNTHILVMSATPIPRSLAIVLYGELKLSIIDEMPKNRLPRKNCVVDESYRPKAYSFIEGQINEKHQAYIICPMIEEGDNDELASVTEYIEELRNVKAFGNFSIECLHAKMKKEEKESIMENFAAGNIDILVSTTVVEVGVNVPNATVMMVENAERFGLAQLHQLRGRVGRGRHQSYCIFVKGTSSPRIDERLDILTKYNDGMMVAQEDMRLRGPGDLFGIRQSGDLDFKMTDIYADAEIVKAASDYVNELSDKDFDKMLEKYRNIFKSVNSQTTVI